MSDEWFPKGEIRLRGWNARECLDFLGSRFEAVRRGEFRLQRIQAGELDGKVLPDGRISLVYRIATFLNTDALVLRARVHDAPGGCTVQYRARIGWATLAFWVLWTLMVLVWIVLTILSPYPVGSTRATLLAIIFFLLPPLFLGTLHRGKNDVEIALAELRAWFGNRIVEETAGA